MTVLSAPLLLAAGCFDAAGNCDINWNLQDCEGAGGQGAGAGVTGTGTTSNTVTTGVPPGCDPLALEGQALPTTCGLFVTPTVGEGVGDGTQMNPYGSIAEALAADPGAAVYVCSTEGELDEAVTLVGTEQLFGGLRCDDWRASGSRTGWTAQPGDIPLTLNGTPSAHVQGFAISSRPVTGHDPVTLQGDSSIAVLANESLVTFVDLSITAGAGAEGGDGESVMPSQAPGRQSNASDFDGNNGMGCSNGAPGNGKTAALACPGGGLISGGAAGGTGSIFTGAEGGDGVTYQGGSPDGVGGVEDPSPGSGFTCLNGPGHGENGQDGDPGDPGPGGTSAGQLSDAGYTGDGGEPGMNGGRAQGGGGGSGRPGNVICGAGQQGLGGGGGGVGGCGGLGGLGGGAGGASIGLLSLQSTLTFTNVTITAAAGGAGGLGGSSQTGGAGGLGGQGGNSHTSACDGGAGGDGGDGGPGGGGAGGPSLGIAFIGTMPDLPDGSITVSSSGATGGDGGNNNAAGNNGATGATAKRQQF